MNAVTAPVEFDDRMEEEETSLLEWFHILWFRRRLLFSVALFIIVIGAINLMQQKSRYTASSSVMIGVPKSQVVDIEAVLGGIATGNDTAIIGEIEVLQSRELAKKVIDKLDLLTREEFNPGLRPAGGLLSHLSLGQYIPDDWKLALGKTPPEEPTEEERNQRLAATATDIFLGKLQVSQLSYSNVVKINFESLDPGLAARVANELPESYIIGQMEAKFEATEKATTWLNDQLSELKDKVAASERAVEMYRDQHGLTEVKGSGVVMEQLAAINSQLIIARAERAEIEARLRHLQSLMKGSRTEIESASEVLSSTLIQRLREQEAQVMRKASELSTEYGAKHPKMLQVEAEIRDIQDRIKREIKKIASGLKNEVDVVRTRERSLKESLDELKQASGLQNQEAVQLRALEREASANRTLFETFLGRFKETSSTSGMEEADARVISKAEVPRSASYPKKKSTLIKIIIGAFFVAGILVLVIQAITPGLLSPEQLENELGIPAIGLIPLVAKAEPQDYILDKPHSSFGEALNSLKTSLILSGPDEAVKTIQITSAVPEEGKSTLALSFARLLAMSGKKVMLVDADLRRASLEKKLGLPTNSKGLTDLVMSNETNLAGFFIKDEKSEVLIMPKGGAKYVNASDIFSSHRMETIIAILRKKFDYVIFDTPPVMAVSDARILGRLVDKTVFVVQWDKTPRKVIKAALQQLKQSDVDIAGCVLQQVNLKRYGSYGYGDSGYYYHHGKYGQYYTS